MTGSTAIDVVLGLAFIYLIYSLLDTSIIELLANLFNHRSRILQKSIRRMLDDLDDDTEGNEGECKSGGRKVLSEAFYSHPRIRCFHRNRFHTLPSYIEPATFANTLIDILCAEVGPAVNKTGKIRSVLEQDPRTAIKIGDENGGVLVHPVTASRLRSMMSEANNDLDRFKGVLEDWYSEMMDRTSGWYKRTTGWRLFAIGIILAGLFNADTLAIVKILSTDDAVREQVVEMARERADQGQVADTLNQIRKDVYQVNAVLGLGWDNYKCKCEENDKGCKTYFGEGLLPRIIGFLLTAIAISLGAPFWFDLLNRVAMIRGSVKPPPAAGTTNSPSP